jgi:radical SAM superfamily enzyme YgiQ (UPF0313 family)
MEEQNLRILLIDPPFHSFMQYDRWHYPTALAQLAAVAHAANHEVSIYDADRYFYKDLSTRDRSVFVEKQHLYYDNVDNFEYYIWQHFKQVLEDFNPEVVGVSIYTCKLKSAINTLKLVKQFNPAVKTCVGGAHVTAVPETLISNDYIDGIFIGYADLTFPEWMANGCPKGIIQSDTSRLDLKALPYARRQALLFQEYFTPKDLSHLMTSRGCLRRCAFCSNAFMWPGKPRFRTSASICAELKELVEEWKCKQIAVGDSTFSDIPAESRRISSVIKEFGVGWSANVTWSSANRDLLEFWVSCGCNKISVGLESGSDKISGYIKKGCNKKLVREKARILNSLGIKWHLFCITGFPIETIDDMKQTLELALEIGPGSISLNSFSPLPGTEIYKKIPKMTPEFASTVNQLHPNYCFSEHMDIGTYRDMFVKMIAVFDEYNDTVKANAESLCKL